MSQDILVVDDEADIRELISGILQDEGYTTRVASSGLKALDIIRERQPNLVILDVWLGDSARDGIQILETIKKDHPFVPVIMISGHGTVETAVSAMKKGAYDFLGKPFKSDHLLLVVERALESARLKRENQDLKVKARVGAVALVGNSPRAISLRKSISQIAESDSRCLILGPVGSGKEDLAREIYESSKRANAPFVICRCANISPKDMEVELFGIDTNQDFDTNTPRKIGLLEKANCGTIYFDEINHLSIPIQVQILRVVREATLRRVAGSKDVPVDIRILAGSSSDLPTLVKSGGFKYELLSALSYDKVELVPLKDRAVDIPFLIDNIMLKVAASNGCLPRRFTSSAMMIMQSYAWPGDLRQLVNVVEWLLLMAPGGSRDLIEDSHLPPEILDTNLNGLNFNGVGGGQGGIYLGGGVSKDSSSANANSLVGHSYQSLSQGSAVSKVVEIQKNSEIIVLPLREAREAFEKNYLLAQLQRFSGNVSQTARFVGMERSALHRKLRALGVGIDHGGDE